MTAPAFDPWAVLATIRGRDVAPPDTAPISRVSSFSSGGTLQFENENGPPLARARFDWPDGVDYWLTKDAVELAGILNTGGTARWCSNGGLDVWRVDGRYRGFSPDLVQRLREAGLLHPFL